MSLNWTDEQLEAINAPIGKGAILVSAAAGSGKTAVLVERILTKILEGKTSMDKILAVTFTNAAASEMREKIIKRMHKELKASSGEKAEYIKRQLRLALSADILTIDSFCLRVLQNIYYVIGEDPNFSIADSAETELLREDAAEALFSRLYKSDSAGEDRKRFDRLLNIYASNRSDMGLKLLIKNIYGFIQSFAEPDKWLDEKAALYREDMLESEWMKTYLIELYVNSIGERYFIKFSNLFNAAARCAGIKPESEITVKNADARDAVRVAFGEMGNGLIKLADAAMALMDAKTWKDAESIYKVCIADTNYIDSFTGRNKPKDIQIPIDVWRDICKRRNDIKRTFFDECYLMAMNETDIAASLKGGELKILADELVWIVKEFSVEYDKRKSARNTKEFSDIEHLSRRIFFENEDIRRKYSERYDEILIDEYQDTNELQDSIFFSISRGEKNLFMVGDLKQSIYRFRGGDPTIFKTKNDIYRNSENNNISITLSQNFRSRQEVLKAVNGVFERTMSNNIGDVNYTGKERIIREADKDVWDDIYKAEMHYIAVRTDSDGDNDADTQTAEAEFTANKIKEMIDSGFLVGDDKHPLKASDIAILVRSVKSGSGKALTKTLEKRGINSYIETEDYFQKREIRLMLSLISVIDNSMQDIPLAAVMRSPIGGFSDNDLAKIRIAHPAGGIYGAFSKYAVSGEEDELKYKCSRLVKSLKRWKNYKKRKSVAELIWSIYEETGLYDFMGALDGTGESQANLRLLYDRAKKFEEAGFKGLFGFIKYIEQIKESQNDMSSANLSDEGHNVVRIMTMHKSKGLEFPVVFLFGTGKRMSGAPSERVPLHKDLGFGLMYADGEKNYFEKNICYEIVENQIMQEEKSESLRLLYVAATRAKDKLIITASKRYSDGRDGFNEKLKKQIDDWKTGIAPTEAKCFADWICPAAITEPKVWNFAVHIYKAYDTDEPDQAETTVEEIVVDDKLRDAVAACLEYSYAYPESGTIPTKTSVSALKQLENKRDYSERTDEYTPICMDDMPAFMANGKKGTEIGTAHHQIMAYINLDKIKKAIAEGRLPETVTAEMDRIAGIGEIERYYVENKQMRDTIASRVEGFFESRLGREMLVADEVYRERAFQINLAANRYDTSLGEMYSGENVILQGIIDCYYKKDGKTVLYDYKTDRCANAADVRRIKERYAVQLNLYAEAIEKITGSSVDEKYLYLFAIGKEVAV